MIALHSTSTAELTISDHPNKAFLLMSQVRSKIGGLSAQRCTPLCLKSQPSRVSHGTVWYRVRILGWDQGVVHHAEETRYLTSSTKTTYGSANLAFSPRSCNNCMSTTLAALYISSLVNSARPYHTVSHPNRNTNNTARLKDFQVRFPVL
jgi:hypothetical protein